MTFFRTHTNTRSGDIVVTSSYVDMVTADSSSSPHSDLRGRRYPAAPIAAAEGMSGASITTAPPGSSVRDQGVVVRITVAPASRSISAVFAGPVGPRSASVAPYTRKEEEGEQSSAGATTSTP